MENYEKLLDEAYKKVKPVLSSSGRFEVAKAEGYVEGNKTIISNFMQISNYLRRSPAHFAKFLLKELATSGAIEGDRLVLQTKIISSRINEKILLYIKEFVICKECSKPDTELLKEGNYSFTHCLACGAKHSAGKI